MENERITPPRHYTVPRHYISAMDDERDVPGDGGRRQFSRVRIYRLGEEPGPDISRHTTAEQRIEMMWPLAVEAWSLTGRAMPAYDRAAMPIRVVGIGAADEDEG